MSVKSLMFPCVESQYTHEYIANVLWRQHIAKVSSITMIPYIKNSEIYRIAYVNIDEWHDSEAAYNIIQRLKSSDYEARIVHNDDNWWVAQLNTHNNGDINVGPYTVKFDTLYFGQNEAPIKHCSEVDDNDYLCDEMKEFSEIRPIKGLGNDYYTLNEARDHIWGLNKQLETRWTNHMSGLDTQFSKMEKELLHFENELRIHEAVNNSRNVTQRALDFGKRKFEEESFGFNQSIPQDM